MAFYIEVDLIYSIICSYIDSQKSQTTKMFKEIDLSSFAYFPVLDITF